MDDVITIYFDSIGGEVEGVMKKYSDNFGDRVRTGLGNKRRRGGDCCAEEAAKSRYTQ